MALVTMGAVVVLIVFIVDPPVEEVQDDLKHRRTEASLVVGVASKHPNAVKA